MIGLITLPSELRYNKKLGINLINYNYGGVLQNYALLKYLKNNDYTIKAIHCNTYTFKGLCKRNIYNNLHIDITKKVKIKKVHSNIKEKNKNFKIFINSNINPQYYYWYNDKVYNHISSNFDQVIIGSDQVWNPQWGVSEITAPTLLLTFLPPEKRVSYAASFGVDTLPEHQKERYSDALSNYSHISVREEAGAKIIKELINKEVPVVLDPTMLLTAEDWRKIEKKSKARNGKSYILTYFLGSISPKRKEYIERIAKENNLEIHSLCDKNDSDVYTAGPAEFLDLFDHASLIFTDSFHATVFSILFNKPFVILDREQEGMNNMNSRIVTLLNKLDLENRLPGKVEDKDLFWHDYTEAYRLLDIERQKSKEYLIKALEK